VDEQKIKDLIYEIQNLVSALGSGGQSSKKLQTDTSSSVSADASTKRLIAALGMLASKIENTTSRVKKTAEEQAASAKEFSKSVDALSKSMDDAAKDAKDAADKKAAAETSANRARLEAAESARRASLSYSEIVKEQKAAAAAASAAAKKEQADSNAAVIAEGVARGRLTKGQALFAKGLSGAGVNLGDSSESLGKSLQQASTVASRLGNTAGSVVSFSAGMTGASQGFEKLNPIIDAAAAALSGIPVLSGVAKAAAEASKFLLAQLQSATTAFQTVSQVGGLTAEGMSGLQRQFLDSGMTLQSYTKTITENSDTLARFAGTVGDGAKTFSQTAGKVQKDFGLSLQRLGYGVDEIGETTASYLALQTRLGLSQKKTVDQLAAGSNKYMLELDALAKLTGASKDEIKKSQDAALSEARFRAKYDDMVANGQEVQAKAMLDFDTMMKKVSPELAQGFRDAATGFNTTQASIKLFNTAGEAGQAAIRGLQNGTMSTTDAMKGFQGGVRENMAQLRSHALQVGNDSGVYVDHAQAANLATANIGELATVTKTQGKQTAPPDKGGDKLTDETVKAQRAMQGVMIQMNELGFKYMPHAATAVAGFTTTLEKSISAMNRALGIKASEIETPRAATKDDIMSMLTPGANNLADLFSFLRKVSPFADGGIAKGPNSGHLAMLHGTEAVIPLKGGGVPVQLSGGVAGGGMDAGPVFNPQTETNYLIEKSNEELVKSNVTLSQILEAITGGATVTGGGGGGGGTSEQVAQEALAEHDHAHPHEPAAAPSAELAAQIGKIVNPLEKMNQTSGFMRNDGKTGHGAIDLAGKIGDKVMAPISGMARVLSEKESGGYGNMVEVTDEKTGVKHMLAHLDKSMVKTGEMIKAGQQIGTLGNTGKSTGAHLHHEMRDKFGKKIDPSSLYSKGPGDTFGSTAGGAATGNPNIARQGRRSGATQYPGPGAAPDMMSGELGKMSEKYETGGRGSGTVGYDKVGGTSYGKYQIASKVGAMKDFLKFAEKSGRGDVAKKLRDAGAESDTGGTSGKSVDVWKQMAAGGELGDLEHQFIKQKSFDPAMSGLKDDDLRKKIEGNKALKEMMWSTSVQHGGGGAAGIMNKVYKKGMSDEDLIKATYAERGTRFGGSTAEVQKGVKNRFVSEEKDVMAMLGMPAGKGVPGAAPRETMVAGAESGPRTTGSLKSALGLPEGGTGAGAGTGGLMGMLGGMLGGGTTAPAGGGGLMGMLGSILGGGATAPGQPDVAGVTAGGAPGAIGGDISAITQAMEAQSAATQTAITSGMENLTTQLVDKLGGAGGTSDPAIPALLSEMIAAQRENTTAINKLIQVSTA
jgi:hypothetical protein